MKIISTFTFYFCLLSISLAKDPMCPNFRKPKCQKHEVLKLQGPCKIPYCKNTKTNKENCPFYNRTNTQCSPERFRDRNFKMISENQLSCTHDTCQRHTYKNAIDDQLCADPAIYYDLSKKLYIRSCSKFFLYTSKNLKHWDKLKNKLVTSPYPKNGTSIWADDKKDWAPEITKIGNKYVAYLTLNDPRNGRDNGIIGVASGPNITSPLKLEPRALVRNDVFGVIDPSYFKDPKTSKHYLLFKLDTNKHSDQQTPSEIIIRELNQEGLKFKKGSKATTLIRGGHTHSTKFEGQDMIEHNGYYYLFYTTGTWRNDYRVYVVRSKSPYGPFKKSGARLFLSAEKSNKVGLFYAPGHGKFVKTADGLYYLYHALKRYPSSDQNAPRQRRLPLLDKVVFNNDWPVINPGNNQGHPSSGSKYVPKPLEN